MAKKDRRGGVQRKSSYNYLKEGMYFNSFLINRIFSKNKKNNIEVFCGCGNLFSSLISNIKRKSTKGCSVCTTKWRRESKYKHKHHNRELYKIWKFINYRCNNKKDPKYKDYGGRGITICKEWHENNPQGFDNFYEFFYPRPSVEHSIDRIDNSCDYTKDNCKWSTQKEQMNNTRVNHLITYKDKTQTLQQWAEEINIKSNTLLYRIKRGWTIEDALTRGVTR